MNFNQKRMVELANTCIQYQKYGYVKMLIYKLVQTGSNDAEVIAEISSMYIKLGQYDKALAYARRAFDLDKCVKTLQSLAEACYLNQEYQDAAIFYEELIKYIPEESTYIMAKNAYKNLGLEEEGIRIMEEGAEKNPTNSLLCEIVYESICLGLDDKINHWLKIIKEKYPNKAHTENVLGLYYEAHLNDYVESKKHYLKAAKMGKLEAYYDLGVCCKHSEDFKESEKYFKRLKLLKNLTVDYNYSLGSIYLAQRKMKQGFKYYGNRANKNNITPIKRKKYWDGKAYPKATIWIDSEQGYGDNIQFSRFLPAVAEKFKNVYYCVDKSLYDILKRSYKKYKNIEIVRMGSKPVNTNKYSLIMDIQNLLNISYHNILQNEPYLITDKEKDYEFKIKHFRGDELKIGLNWRAKGMGLRDAVYRTIDAPYYFKDLFNIPDTKFYSFQMNDIFGMLEKYPQITDLTPDISTFDDTASMLKNLDVLITVDTAIAHLAGALGVKTYLLLCFAPDWRWFDNDKKTEWYPNVTIIKQHDRRSWDDVAKTLYNYILEEHEKKH